MPSFGVADKAISRELYEIAKNLPYSLIRISQTSPNCLHMYLLSSSSWFPENLFPCPEEELVPIMHWEVGKYFAAFTGSKYLPNKPLNEMYPD